MSKRFLDSVGLKILNDKIISALNKKADGKAVYTKDEVDELLNEKANVAEYLPLTGGTITGGNLNIDGGCISVDNGANIRVVDPETYAETVINGNGIIVESGDINVHGSIYATSLILDYLAAPEAYFGEDDNISIDASGISASNGANICARDPDTGVETVIDGNGIIVRAKYVGNIIELAEHGITVNDAMIRVVNGGYLAIGDINDGAYPVEIDDSGIAVNGGGINITNGMIHAKDLRTQEIFFDDLDATTINANSLSIPEIHVGTYNEEIGNRSVEIGDLGVKVTNSNGCISAPEAFFGTEDNLVIDNAGVSINSRTDLYINGGDIIVSSGNISTNTITANNIYTKDEVDELLSSVTSPDITSLDGSQVTLNDSLAEEGIVTNFTNLNEFVARLDSSLCDRFNDVNQRIDNKAEIEDVPSIKFKVASRATLGKNECVDVSSYMEQYDELMIVVRAEVNGETKIGVSNSANASNSGFLCSSSAASGTTYLKIKMNKTDEGYYAWEVGSSFGWTSSTGYKYIRNYSSAATSSTISVVIHGR